MRGLKTSARKGDNSHIAAHEFDGDGRRLKIVETKTVDSVTTTTTTYEIRSSALGGQIIAEVNGQGAKTKQYVYTSGGEELASGTSETSMVFVHRDPITGTEQKSWNNGLNSGRTEFDPVGADVGLQPPDIEQPDNDLPLRRGRPSDPFNRCARAGLPDICSGPNYAFWGIRIADLPGFGTNWGSMVELGERQYARRVAERIILLMTRERRHIQLSDIERLRAFAENYGSFENFTPQNTRTLTPSEIDHLKGDVAGLLKGKCLTLVQGILKRLNSPTNDIMQVFAKITKFDHREMKASAAMFGTLGMIKSGKMEGFNLSVNYASLDNPASRAYSGRIIIHELIHAASSSVTRSNLHYEMDQAAWDVAREMGVKENEMRKRTETRTDGLDNERADLFTDIIMRFCHAGN